MADPDKRCCVYREQYTHKVAYPYFPLFLRKILIIRGVDDGDSENEGFIKGSFGIRRLRIPVDNEVDNSITWGQSFFYPQHKPYFYTPCPQVIPTHIQRCKQAIPRRFILIPDTITYRWFSTILSKKDLHGSFLAFTGYL